MTAFMAPTLDTKPYPLSVEAYHALGDLGLVSEEVELLDGFLYRKLSKSPLHETIVHRLLNVISAALSNEYLVTKERPLSTPTSEPEPDLAVIRGSYEDFTHSHPSTAELVVEVSINTMARDRQKADIYAAAGVTEYWLIEPEQNSCTIFTQPSSTGYQASQKYVSGVEIRCGALPQLVVSLEQILRH